VKIKSFELSNENEGTAYPYWVIIDVHSQLLSKKNYDIAASFVTGIFFSRESAEEYLKRKSHHFTKNAVVYCMSGYGTDWEDLIRKSEGDKNEKDN